VEHQRPLPQQIVAQSGSNGDGAHASAHHSDRISTASSPKTARILAIIAIVVLAVLAVGFAVQFIVRHHRETQVQDQTAQSADAMAAVDVVTVQPTATTYPLSLPGQTAGWYESTIYARDDGYIGKWFADIGDHVKQGQVLATIETPELDEQLAAARAKLNASNAQVQVAQSSQAIAKITFDRWWESPAGVVSEQERQEKKSTYDSAIAQLAEARAQAQLDQAGVDRLVTMQTFRSVTAPYDGIITGRHVDIGDLVTAGSTASTSSLYNLAQANVIRTFVDVPQKAAGDMAVGLDADAASNQFPGRLFHGKVARSSMSIDPQSRTMRVEVDIPNPDLLLLPGMYVDVTFQLKQRGLLQVPASAMLFKPQGLQVAVVDADGKVSFCPITVARDDGDTVEIATGLQSGDRVALNISSGISQGQQVAPVDVDATVAMVPPPLPAAPAAEVGPPQSVGTASPFKIPAPNSGMNPPAPARAPALNAIPDPGESPPPASNPLTGGAGDSSHQDH
jgi:RND family efflux transporter MFP subunit